MVTARIMSTNIKRIPNRPTRPINFVATDDLVHELLMSLKDVVACQSALANSDTDSNGNKTSETDLQKLKLAISKVSGLHSRVNGRGMELDETLKEASHRLDLDLNLLLDDCLRFPEVFPYVRNIQGLRKYFLCSVGSKKVLTSRDCGYVPTAWKRCLSVLKTRKKIITLFSILPFRRKYAAVMPTSKLYSLLLINQVSGYRPGVKFACSKKKADLIDK